MHTALTSLTAVDRTPGAVARFLRAVLPCARTAPAAPAVRRVAARTTVWIARPQGRTIRCEAGRLWLSFDGEARDVVLDAGESHLCTLAAPLAIHGLTAAAFRAV
jgi:hypothetical protein